MFISHLTMLISTTVGILIGGATLHTMMLSQLESASCLLEHGDLHIQLTVELPTFLTFSCVEHPALKDFRIG